MSSPKCIRCDVTNTNEDFYYDDYCIFHNHFKIRLECGAVAKALFTELPILTGIYDSVNKVYSDEYAPVSIVVCNNSANIEKFVIEAEIMGVSYKYIKELCIEPFRVDVLKAAPRLKEDKVLKLRINMEYDLHVNGVRHHEQTVNGVTGT